MNLQTVALEWSRSAAHFIPRLLLGLMLFAVFWTLGGIAKRLMLRLRGRFDDKFHIVINLTSRLSYITLLVVGVITALGTMGINVSALVAGLGLTGFAVGFALKDALANVLAGALILIYRPFVLRDYISVSGLEGRVTNIDFRYTTLENDQKIFLIPNSSLFTNPIILTPSGRPS